MKIEIKLYSQDTLSGLHIGSIDPTTSIQSIILFMTHNTLSFLSSYLQFIGSYGKKYIQKKKKVMPKQTHLLIPKLKSDPHKGPFI